MPVTWISVSPKIPKLKSYPPKMTLLQGGTFRSCLGHDNGALINGISIPNPLYQVKITAQSWVFTNHHKKSKSAANWKVFPTSRTTRNDFLLFINYPVCGTLPHLHKWTKILRLCRKQLAGIFTACFKSLLKCTQWKCIIFVITKALLMIHTF